MTSFTNFDDIPRHSFGVICADFPSKFKTRSPKGITTRSPDHHYCTMTLEDVAAMPVKDLALPDCHLFFWVTGPFLAIGAHIPIMKAWGFKPTAMGFNWIKTKKSEKDSIFLVKDESFHMSTGYTTRKNAEFVVIGRRGNPKRLHKGIRELIIAPVREHSRKPDDFFERVAKYAAGPYLELFARQSRENWTTWGNEPTKFDSPATKAPRTRIARAAPKPIAKITDDLFAIEGDGQ